MSSTKRRLSSNSGLLKMCDEENSDDDDLASVGLQEKSIYTFPKKNNARRRSSFGGLNSTKSPVNAAEQARITEMYKTVIQLSSENKLNEKNSWNYDLIDHMGKLIKDDSRGVNFQKASCTLDASVKIYSNRVDDTYTSSHRILESLSRNGTSNSAEADDENDVEESENPEGTRKRSTKTSTRLNIATTIERNVSALNAVKLENDVAVDPMFHKISKAFDEGGAKGMLMNNLRTASTGCSLSFHFADPEPASTVPPAADIEFPSSLIDISDLLARSGISASELSELCVCPALDMYRDQIGLSTDYLLGSVKEVLTSTAMHAIPSASGDDTHLTAKNISPAQRQSTDGATAEWEDSNNDNDFGYSGHDDGDDFDSSALPSTRPSLEPFNARLSGIAGSPSRASLAGSMNGGEVEGHKLRWADLEAPTNSTAGNPSMVADMEVLVQGLENITISNSGPSEYSYFDTNAIFSSSNAWAGARHWKYATRKRVAKEAEVTPETANDEVSSDAEVSGTTATTAKGAKKSTKSIKKPTKKVDNKAVIEFSADLVDVSLFDLPSAKSKSDTTQQTAAAITKLQSAAATLFLPPDAKVQVKDLCRLYLAPHVMIPANNVQRAVLASSSVRRSGSNKIDRFLAGQSGSERVWGVSGPTNLQTAVRGGASGNVIASAGATAAAGDEGGYDSGEEGFGYGDYDDGDHYDGGEGSGAGGIDTHSALPPVLSGLDINTGQLLQADRKVEKIEIGYAKVSKRVNIQRLKIDIWSNLSSQLPVDTATAANGARKSLEGAFDQATTAAHSKQQLSFQEVITEIAGEDGGARQQDVTLPFYFICLLHLANEHGLRIEDREDMSDLVISMDQK